MVVPDPIFVSVIRTVLTDAHANVAAYQSPPTFEMVQRIVKAALEMHRNPETGSQTFSGVVVGEIYRVVGEILQSIYIKYENARQEVNI